MKTRPHTATKVAADTPKATQSTLIRRFRISRLQLSGRPVATISLKAA
jgi:hypothetical protein